MRQAAAAAAAAACWYLDSLASCTDTGSSPANPGCRICPNPAACKGTAEIRASSPGARHGRAVVPGRVAPLPYRTTPHGRTEPGTLTTAEPSGESILPIRSNSFVANSRKTERDFSAYFYSVNLQSILRVFFLSLRVDLRSCISEVSRKVNRFADFSFTIKATFSERQATQTANHGVARVL